MTAGGWEAKGGGRGQGLGANEGKKGHDFVPGDARHTDVTRMSDAIHTHVTRTSHASHTHVTRMSRARHTHVTRRSWI